VTRRHFLQQSAAAGTSATVTPRAAAGNEQARNRQRILPLWGDETALLSFGRPHDDSTVAEFVEKCARHGVTRLIPSGGSRRLVEAARARNIEVHPYSAFNSHGRSRVIYSWSMDFFEEKMDGPAAREKLDRHRPVWSTPSVNEQVSDFARQHPPYWALARDRGRRLKPGEKLSLSLAIPEVREYEKARYLKILESTGGAGLQLEFTLKNQDAHGVDTSGYEEAVTKAFEKQHGRNPLDLPNGNIEWVQFRAGYVTDFLREVRSAVRQVKSGALLTTTVIAREMDQYRKVLQDWPVWLDQGSIDEVHIWFRTTNDVKMVERYTRQAAEVIKGRCPLIVELSCYHVGSFQDPRSMLEAASRAFGSGASGVGIYRSHAVEQLDFWPLLEKIAKL